MYPCPASWPRLSSVCAQALGSLGEASDDSPPAQSPPSASPDGAGAASG